METTSFKSNNNNNPNSCESSSLLAENGKLGDHKKKNGKSSRSKGVKLSTDPQSVAARERRHRISNRFKMLQSLVPGGTKMDTASMLDEAIHYVKYLKAQIWLHESMINFNNNIVDDDDHDLSSTVLLPSSSSVDFADHEEALLMYSQSQSQPQQQQPEFYGGVQPSPPLPNCCYQLEEGTMYFDGYMQ